MTSAAGNSDLRRSRRLALLSLLGVAAIAWLYLWIEAGRMMPMDGSMKMSMSVGMYGARWSLGALVLTFLMWSIMMVGMMLPSAAPAIMLYGMMVRKGRENGSTLAPLWVFAGGYLAVWTAFSLGATLLQFALESARLVSPHMISVSVWLSGGLLIAAGVYQWLPIKDMCLKHCQSPLSFFLTKWRAGRVGAFRMGAHHGLFCLGCCWAIMLLLFAGGIMNLLWVALIAAFVFIEKVLPWGAMVGRIGGIGFIVAGVWWIVAVV